MKRLVCEMCGGTDLIKQEGVFVCENCGMKYSVEEAKKMMIEGTVEVQGTVAVQGAVNIKNTAQLENLMRLAESSYASKNYSQAEEFCNQVIAMDASNYEAWKLKGEAINYQITGTNDRITEVYNCIMTSYRVLDEAGKDEHRDMILASLRECLEGEIDFVLKLFKSNRPSDAMLAKVKNTFINCASNVITSYTELGYTEAEADEYRTYIKNYFIKKVNVICDSTWDDVVYHNYYRGGWTDEYRPNTEIMQTYLHEGDNLIALLTFAEGYFTTKTPPIEKRRNYELQNFMHGKLINATSYKRMVRTTTNGYGAVISKQEYWDVDKTLTESSKINRRKLITKTCELYDKMDLEVAQSDPAAREKMLSQWQKELGNLDLGYHLGGGYIFSILMCLGIAVLFYTAAPGWIPNIDWFWTIAAIGFLIGAIACACSAHKNAKREQEASQAKAARLEKKIRDLTKR